MIVFYMCKGLLEGWGLLGGFCIGIGLLWGSVGGGRLGLLIGGVFWGVCREWYK